MNYFMNKSCMPLCVTFLDGLESSACVIAADLSLPVLEYKKIDKMKDGTILVLSHLGLAIQRLGKNSPGPVRCDFINGTANHRRLYGGGKNQDIAKAVGVSNGGYKPFVVDLTAGLGGDGFVLASLGVKMLMIERNPVVSALLHDGLARARSEATDTGTDLEKILKRISLVHGDADFYLRGLEETSRPDVFYLDPMFPCREKSSKVKKEMQLLHQLLGSDDDGSSLLALAKEKARYRVVVKRSAHAPFLANQQPGYSLKGKSTRFDIYPLKKLPS